jgi:hypothetical protein
MFLSSIADFLGKWLTFPGSAWPSLMIAFTSRMFPIAMNAMSPDDLKDMITFRLNVAGHNGVLFEDNEDAYKMLYLYTKGLPRDAIKVCFELLIELAAQGKKKATAKQVEEIAKGQNLRT